MVGLSTYTDRVVNQRSRQCWGHATPSYQSNESLMRLDLYSCLAMILRRISYLLRCLHSGPLGLVQSHGRSSLPLLRIPIQQFFGSLYLGNIAATVSRLCEFGEFDGGLLIQSPYYRRRKHRKIAIVNSRHLSCQPCVVGNNGKQSV